MDEEPSRIGLEEAAAIIGVHRATVNEMIRDGRLPAERIGPHWFVERPAVETFAQAYVRPKSAPKRHPSNTTRGMWTEEILSYLNEWHNATVSELQSVVNLHPGNIRKYLALAEADGLTQRDEYSDWSLTPAGAQWLWLGERTPPSVTPHLRTVAG
jgi:excisionase family DNA binding protein